MKAFTLMCNQFAIIVKAGIPIASTVQLIAAKTTDKTLKRILNQVAGDVESGRSLAASFEERGGKLLPPTFIETIRAGEESGKLDECFERLQAYYENADAVSSKVTSALVYPVMLIAVAVIVVAIIMIKAVPVFESSFANMGNERPLPTKLLIAMSHFMVDNWLLLAAILAAAGLGLTLYGKTDNGRHLYARLALTFPGFDMINRMNAASEFSSTLSTMLAAGLPLVQATRITAATTNNVLISEDIEAAVQGVIEGNRLGDGLKKSSYLPALLLEMTAVGEETGKLEDTLNVVSTYYTKEVDVAVKRALDILNPCITIVLAILVVFILLSVYLPIFGLYGNM
jgi:type IV pilus assembly protein PilC